MIVRNSLCFTRVKYSYPIQTDSALFNAIHIFPLFQILAVFACIASTQSVKFQRVLNQHHYLAVNRNTFRVSANGRLGSSGRPCYSAFAEGGSSFKMRFLFFISFYLFIFLLFFLGGGGGGGSRDGDWLNPFTWRFGDTLIEKTYTKSVEFVIAGEKNVFVCNFIAAVALLS